MSVRVTRLSIDHLPAGGQVIPCVGGGIEHAGCIDVLPTAQRQAAVIETDQLKRRRDRSWVAIVHDHTPEVMGRRTFDSVEA